MKIHSPNPPRPLNIDSHGRDVLRVEKSLRALGYQTGKVDGVYDSDTFKAVREFKKDEPELHNTHGFLRLRGQKVLAQRVAQKSGATGQDTTLRAVGFNWTERYRKGGNAGDEALLDRLKKQSDVLGLTEFKWGDRITDGEKGWSFYHPNPKNDGQKDIPGEVLGWRTDKFKCIDKGTFLLNTPTRIQPGAAGPARHAGKSIVWAKLKDRKTGEVFTMGVVHFVPSKQMGGLAEKLWKKQRDGVKEWFKQQGPRTVLMGDFNGGWDAPIAAPLHKVASAQTAPSHGGSRIDWILRSKDLQGVGPGAALDNGGQSDHKPVRGVIRG